MQQQMFAHSTIAGGGRQKEKFHRGVPQIPLLQFAAKANSGKSEEKKPGQQQRLYRVFQRALVYVFCRSLLLRVQGFRRRRSDVLSVADSATKKR
jgi:hypothetical protein